MNNHIKIKRSRDGIYIISYIHSNTLIHIDTLYLHTYSHNDCLLWHRPYQRIDDWHPEMVFSVDFNETKWWSLLGCWNIPLSSIIQTKHDTSTCRSTIPQNRPATAVAQPITSVVQPLGNAWFKDLAQGYTRTHAWSSIMVGAIWFNTAPNAYAHQSGIYAQLHIQLSGRRPSHAQINKYTYA